MCTDTYKEQSAGWLKGLCYSGPWSIVVIMLLVLAGNSPVQAGDPFKGSQTRPSQFGDIENQELDQEHWDRPQSVFSWIAMAHGYQTPWDTVGRPGWMNSDAYLKPVDPGVSVFPPDTPEIFIVFEAQPLDAPGQFAAAWFLLKNGKPVSDEPLGRDYIELEMNQKSGYFILSPTTERWEKGDYLVKIYFGAPGQHYLHAINMLGTMKFTISDEQKGS